MNGFDAGIAEALGNIAYVLRAIFYMFAVFTGIFLGFVIASHIWD